MGGSTEVILNGVLSTLLSVMVPSLVLPSPGASSRSGVRVTYAGTLPCTVSITGAWPSIWKVTRLLSGTPGLGPGFRLISTSAEAPGAMGSLGTPAVVQPQLVMAFETVIGLSLMLVIFTLPLLAVSTTISPRSSSSGSSLTTGVVSTGACTPPPVGVPTPSLPPLAMGAEVSETCALIRSWRSMPRAPTSSGPRASGAFFFGLTTGASVAGGVAGGACMASALADRRAGRQIVARNRFIGWVLKRCARRLGKCTGRYPCC